MPSPGPVPPGRVAKPRPWPTGGGKRRPEWRGGGSVLRGSRAARRTAHESPPPCGWRAGGRARDARGKFITTRVFHISIKYPSNKLALQKSHDNAIFSASLLPIGRKLSPSSKYPASKIFKRPRRAKCQRADKLRLHPKVLHFGVTI